MIKASKKNTRFFFITINYFDLIYKKYPVRKSVKIGNKKNIYLKSKKTKQTFAYVSDFKCTYEGLFRLYTSWQ